MDIKVLIQSLFDAAGTDRARDEFGRFAGEGKKTASSLDSAFKGITGSIAVVGMAITGITAAVGLAGSAIEKALGPSIEMEQLTTQFSVLLGGIDAAADRMVELTEFADKTPFNLPEVAKASTVLETLTRGALATGKGLTLVGDLAAGTGQPFNELAIWVGRLYDGLQSGRPVGEAMARLQELGIVSGSTRGQIEKLQASGAKGPEIWAVAEQAFGRYAGMMEQQAQTFGGMLSTLQDAFSGFLRVAFGDATSGSKSILQFLIDLLSGLQEPLKELIIDAQVFWAAMYGDDAQSFGEFMRTNALPALTALMGAMMDIGKIAVGLWESTKGVARLAMSGLFQLFQGLYALIMGIPAAFLLALEKVLGLIRSALNALPEALRPEGVARFIQGQQGELQDTLGSIKTGFDTLGGMSQVFADQAAENFAATGFAWSQVGKDQGRIVGRGKAAAGGAGGAGGGGDTGSEGDGKLTGEQKNALEVAKWEMQQQEAKAAHEEELRQKLFATRSKQEKQLEAAQLETQKKLAAEEKRRTDWIAGQIGAVMSPVVNGISQGLNNIMTKGKLGAIEIGRQMRDGLLQAAADFIAKMAMGGIFKLVGGFLGGGIGTGLADYGKGLMGFASGTPNLPRDMVAMVHKSEIIAPPAESEAARAGNFGPLAKFLGVQGGGQQGIVGRGRLISLEDEVLAVLQAQGSAVVRIMAGHQTGFAGA